MITKGRPTPLIAGHDSALPAMACPRLRVGFGVGAAPLIATLLAGCTIIKPIQPPPAVGFFSSEPVAVVAKPPCGSSSRAAHCYVAGLGDAIQTVDARRTQLAGWAADISNTNSAFNALLWPLSAVLLVNAQNWSDANLLKGMAALAAGYGFLSSGVPERQEYYLAASRRLFCAILHSRPKLYQTWDYEQGPVRVMGALEAQLVVFSKTRYQTLRELHARPRAVRARPDTVPERRLAQLEGKKGGSAGVSNPVGEIEKRTFEQLREARATYEAARELQAEIMDAARALAVQRDSIDADLQTRLSAKVAPLSNPADVQAQLLALVGKLTGKGATVGHLQGASAEKKSAQEALDPRIPAKLRAALTKDSQEALNKLEDETYALLEAVRDVQGWLDAHRQRSEQIGIENAQVGCAAIPGLPLAAVAPPAERMQRAETAATPPGGDSPMSGTPLPTN